MSSLNFIVMIFFSLFFLSRCENINACGDNDDLLSIDEVKKMRLWTHFDEQLKFKDDTLKGFDKSIRMIYKHQYEVNCSEVKFLIAGGHGFGFGSNIHVEAIQLAIAMNIDRVLLRNPIGDKEPLYTYNVPFCLNQSNIAAHFTMECYYEPWSKCSINDVIPKFYSYNQEGLTTIIEFIN